MPRLHKYRDRDASYVLTAIRGAVVTFQLTADVAPEGGISNHKLDETKSALRELGMNDDINLS